MILITDKSLAATNGPPPAPPLSQLPGAAAPASVVHDEPINILIVDDEPKNLTVLETVLDNPGYRLVRAGSADEALLALLAEEFALLILDIRMPGMTGFELAQIIKERKKTAGVPIIFLTAYYNEDQHVLEGYGTGAVDYLHKPINPAILLSKVAVFAELHRKSRELELANRALLAEITLRQTREQFIDLFENAPIGYHEFDTEGRLARINRTELNLLGYSADELLGQFVWKLYADEASAQQSIMAIFASKQHPSQPFEGMFRRKDGTTFPVLIDVRLLKNEDDTIIGFRSVIQDLTARKQAEETAQHLACFPELNPNPVLEFSADGTLVYHNPASLIMAQKVGIPNLDDLLPPLTRQIVVECLTTNQPHLRLETHHGKYTLSWSFYPIASQQTVHCYVGNISQRLLLEAEFRQSQKMEAIGQLSGGVAHDFNNLLTVIMGNLGLIQSSDQVGPELAESVHAISHAAKRAANLTRQLLAFSRRQVMQAQDLDLNEVVEHITKMLHRVIGEEVKLKLEYAPQILPIHADPGMLEQAILNLSINARDAMPKGGQLILRTAAINLTEEEAAPLRSARAGAFAVMTVADTGTGILPENIEHVFESFFTTKEVGKGTGLGLASVYGIAQQHRGWVTVASEVGRGTTFNVYVPLLTTPVVTASPAALAKEIPCGTETILLVEDDQAVQMMANIALTRLGYRVMVASNGHEALNLWEAHKTEIQLVLTDMIMPEGLSGRDIARRFKKESPEIKIIFMSGYNAEIDSHDFSKNEGDLFLGKPFEIHVFAAMIRKSLDTTCLKTRPPYSSMNHA